MMKFLKFLFVTILLFTALFGFTNQASAQINPLEINIFYTETCPHCQDALDFLDGISSEIPFVINRHDIADPGVPDLLTEFARHHGAEQYVGIVPLTFLMNTYVVGFDRPETTGDVILSIIAGAPISDEVELAAGCDIESESEELCLVDFSDGVVVQDSYTNLEQVSHLGAIGIDARDLSLPVLAVVLGFFDGFNICSLGALLLILSLVLTFKSRKKAILYGGLFIIITGITYAALIFIWFALFELLAPFTKILEIIIGAIGIIGGIYFLRQYYRFKKYGPTCDATDSKWIQKVTAKLQSVFSNKRNVWITVLAVILFSFVVTVIEFPCSAVIPVTFAAILAEAGVGLGLKSLYLLIFMIFYLLDEITIFLIAVWTLRIWTGSTKITSSLTLVQAILFIALGLFYIWRLVN